MTYRPLAGAAILLLFTALPLRAADAAYSIKVQDKAPAPKEVQEPIRKLLAEQSVQLLDAKGEVLCELWFIKTVEAKATEAQIKNGLTYREVPQTTVLGVLRVVKPMSDYRKQKIAAGVYTLRLGYQPMDGDHMGTAPYSEFCLVSPAAADRSPDLMEPKAMQEMSGKTTAGHPCVLLLFPGKAAGAPKLADKGDGHWVLEFKQDVTADGKKATLGVGLTLIGFSASA
jgi:hypothetical protein